jgi:hypothetical protein
LMSRAGIGTEVELRVRGQIAFELTPSKLASKWLTTFQNRQSQHELTPK